MNRLNHTVTALQNAGFRADCGYPGKLVQVPDSPIITVTIERSSQKEIVLAVTIYGPPELGGQICEELAQEVAATLRGLAARCEVGICQFEDASGLFRLKVLATWKKNLHNRVRIDGQSLVYANEFSAVQTRQVEKVVDEETGQEQVINEEVIWTVAVQELLPFSQAMEVDHKEAFTLSVVHENCVETYPECYWLSITLEETDGGLIRKRIARSWTERIVEITEA